MPIANCILRVSPDTEACEGVLGELSRRLDIEPENITLNFTNSDHQVGQRYDLMIHLYLPSLWTAEEAEKIGLVFIEVISKGLGVRSEDASLITTIVQSGHVIDNGTVQRWE